MHVETMKRLPADARPARLRMPIVLGAILAPLLAAASSLEAQSIHVPGVQSGAYEFMLRGHQTLVHRIGTDDGSAPLGSTSGITATAVRYPLLEGDQNRLRDLLADGSQELSAGTLLARHEINDQEVVFRLDRGITSRFGMGLSVPVVRRRVESRLYLDEATANVGLNPAVAGSAAAVNAFRSSAVAALERMVTEVDATCAAGGSTSSACLEGLAARARVEQLVGRLSSAWQEGGLFPLSGTPTASALQGRWDAARADLARWGGEDAPLEVPMATRLSDEARVQALLATDGWGAGGFPVSTPETTYAFGDPQLHLVGLLLHHRTPGGIGLKSAIEGSVWLGTGPADSLALVAPTGRPRGHSGVGVRWVSDLSMGSQGFGPFRGLTAEVGWETYFETDVVVLGARAEDPWAADTRRQVGRGAPGDRMTVALAPRGVLVPGLSVGAGWMGVLTTTSQWTLSPAATGVPVEPLPDTPGPVSSVERSGHTSHQLFGELVFTSLEAPLRDGVRFPVEVMLRGAHTLSGSEGAPLETRLTLGARVGLGGRRAVR
jgi:hypothetical protein